MNIQYDQVSQPQESSKSVQIEPPLSSSVYKPSLAEEYSQTFNRLLEEKEAIIQNLLIENQRLSQLMPRTLNPQPLSPELKSPLSKDVDYKRLLDLENLKTQHEKRIQEIEKENEFLRGKVTKMNQELMILTRRLEIPMEEDQEDDGNLNEMHEISNLRAQITFLKSQNEQQIHEIDRLTQINQDLLENRDNSSLNSDHHAHSNLSSSSTRAQREIEMLRSINQELENKLLTVTHNESLLNHKLESLISEKQHWISNSDARYVEGLKTRLYELDAMLFSLRQENNELSTEKKLKEQMIFEIRGMKDAVSEKYEFLKDEAQKAKLEKELLEKEFNDLQRKIQEISNEKEQILQENQEKNAQKFKILAEINDLREVIQTLKNEKNRVSYELRQELESTKNELESKMQECDDLGHYIEELEEKMKNMNGNQTNLRAEYQIITEEMMALKQETKLKDEKISIYTEEIKNYLIRLEACELRKAEQEIVIRDLQDQYKDCLLKDASSSHEKDEIVELLNETRGQISVQVEKYTEIINLQELHMKFLKERYLEDIKAILTKINKNGEKSVTEVAKILEGYKDFSFNISHKEAVIKQLKDQNKFLKEEIKNLKYSQKNLLAKTVDKKAMQQTQKTNYLKETNNTNSFASGNNNSNVIQMNRLENQLLSVKTMLKSKEEELTFTKNIAESLESQLNIKESELSRMKDKENFLEKELFEREKKHKAEITQLIQKNDCLAQDQRGFEDQYQENEALFLQIKEANQALSASKEELIRKNTIIQSSKAEIDSLNKNLIEKDGVVQQLTEEIERIKKSSKENVRKEQNYKLFQEKLDQSKNLEKQWNEEKANLNEKIKVLKTDLQRKEQFNKDLKEKLDSALVRMESSKILQDENEKIKDSLRRMKGELERKESSIILLKEKLDECLAENNQLKVTKTTKMKEPETKKIDYLKSSLKKSENYSQLLMYILKRLYRENYANLKKIRNRGVKENSKVLFSNESKGVNEKAFADSLNILQISKEDLNDFLNPKKQSLSSPSTNIDEDKALEKFESVLQNEENLNVNELYSLLYGLIEQRIQYEKEN